MRLLFFRRTKETNELDRADTGSSPQWVPEAGTSCQEADSLWVEDELAIGANSEMAHWALDWAG
jgi:hypothetical protein